MARIRINGHRYYLGTFKHDAEARQKYKHDADRWVQFGELPKHVHKPRNTNEKYISFIKKSKKFRFQKITNGKRITKYFDTLVEVIAFKHKYLGGN